MKPKTSRLCTLVTRTRSEKGDTCQKAAALLGVSKQTVSLWEHDERHPDVDNLMRLAKYTGVSVERLRLMRTRDIIDREMNRGR